MSDNETGILTPDQITQIRKREDANKRKRDQRARDKVEQNAAKVAEENLTPHEFWSRNRKGASDSYLSELESRQEDVFSHLHWMEKNITGEYNDPASKSYCHPNDETVYVGLTEGTQDIAFDVNQFGVCDTEVYLLNFWVNPNIFSKLTQRAKHATSIFMKYGVVTAIPSHRLHGWDSWLASQKPQFSTRILANGYTTLTCANSPACPSMPDSVPQKIADGYREKRIDYLCHVCISRGRSGNAAIAKALAKEYNQPESSILDGWGKVKL
jgi:hypothetical protein